MKKFVLIIICGIIFTPIDVIPQVGKYRSGIFLSHSTGLRIWGPNGSTTSVPQEIVAYNRAHGLFDSDSVTLSRRDWPEVPWNNEWERWHRIFDNTDVLADIRPLLANNKIIIIKSCFPSSELAGIGGAADTLTPVLKTIYNYKWHWRNFISVMKQNQENYFVVWTNAPRTSATTSNEAARLSDQFCKWAKDTLFKSNDPIFGAFPTNVYVFDFFHKLADSSGKLPLYYATAPDDSHPNSLATALVAPQFVQEIFDASIAYEGSATIPSIPFLIMPENGSVDLVDQPTLKWTKDFNAISYHLQVSIDSGFSSIILDDSTLVDTSKMVGPLANLTKFYWHVRAKNNLGTSEWSERWNFTSTSFTWHYYTSQGWNLASLPINVSDFRTSFLYPLASSAVFEYRGNYQSVDTIKCGTGFWIKFDQEETIPIKGIPITDDTIDVIEGWNLIGSVGIPILVSSIISEPGEMVTSAFFKYDGNYNVSDTISPGDGYWVKVDRDGKLYISSTPIMNSARHINIQLSNEYPPSAPESGSNSVSADENAFHFSNHPNPFNPKTTIQYYLSAPTHVKILVLNLLGQEIKLLVDRHQAAGKQSVSFDASDLPSGTYFCKIQTTQFIQLKKILLMK